MVGIQAMELSVQKREVFGRKVEELRKSGLVPAELYGRGIENLHLSVAVKDFNKIFKQAGENTMVDLVIDSATSKEKRPVLIYNVQNDPVTDQIASIDFYQVRLDERIKISVPLEFFGEAPAVKNKSGILVKTIQAVDVEALPDKIPHSIRVDLGRLSELDRGIAIKDLDIPPEVKILVDLENVVAIVKPPLSQEQEEALAQKPAVEEVKVETEEKKAARAAKTEEKTGEAQAAPTESKK